MKSQPLMLFRNYLLLLFWIALFIERYFVRDGAKGYIRYCIKIYHWKYVTDVPGLDRFIAPSTNAFNQSTLWENYVIGHIRNGEFVFREKFPTLFFKKIFYRTFPIMYGHVIFDQNGQTFSVIGHLYWHTILLPLVVISHFAGNVSSPQLYAVLSCLGLAYYLVYKKQSAHFREIADFIHTYSQ